MKASPEERAFLKAIKAAQFIDQGHSGILRRTESAESCQARLVYADWLEEQARPLDAAKQRARAGVSEILYQARMDEGGHRVGIANGKLYRSAGMAARQAVESVGGMDRQGFPRRPLPENIVIVAVERHCRDVQTIPLADALVDRER